MMNVSPDPDEIVQSEEEYNRPVPVSVCGPVETREYPAVRAGYKTEQGVTTSLGIRLLSFEPRRKTATIVANDQDIWVSGSQAGAQAGAAGAFRVAAVVPFVIGHLDEVWACAVTGTTDVSVMSEYWSE